LGDYKKADNTSRSKRKKKSRKTSSLREGPKKEENGSSWGGGGKPGEERTSSNKPLGRCCEHLYGKKEKRDRGGGQGKRGRHDSRKRKKRP